MKEKLFKLFFPSKSIEIEALKRANNDFARSSLKSTDKIEEKKITEADVMKYCLETLNVPWIDFANVDDNGLPPYYLEGLSEAEYKNWIAHLESIYKDPKFQTVVNYIINVLGNYSIQKADNDKMINGKLGIIGIRTLMSEFINAHEKYSELKKKDEDWDPFAPLPE